MKRKQAETAEVAAKKRAVVAASTEAQAQGSSQRFNQGSQPPVARLQMVGLCYRCGKLGHLVANCPKPKQQYSFEQSLVKGTKVGINCVS